MALLCIVALYYATISVMLVLWRPLWPSTTRGYLGRPSARRWLYSLLATKRAVPRGVILKGIDLRLWFRTIKVVP